MEPRDDQEPGEDSLLLQVYGQVLQVYKVQNDVYFKRVQIFLPVLQGGLFVIVFKCLDQSDPRIAQAVLAIGASVAGGLCALAWLAQQRRTCDYMEFTRRHLRNIEVRLGKYGIPLAYFTTESVVFSDKGTTPGTSLGGVCIKPIPDRKRRKVKFEWSGDCFPSSGKRAKGGMMKIEKYLAYGAMVGWVLVLVAVILQLCCCCH